MAQKPRSGTPQASSAAEVTAPPWGVPPSWLWTTVQAVGSVRLGRQRSPETKSAQYPTKYLRAANITTDGLDLTEVLEMDFDPVERQTYRLRSGDLVLAEASGSAAHVGRAAIWSDEIPGCCFQNTVIRFRPHAVNSEYALIVFRHLAQLGAFASVAHGVGIQHLGAAQFMRMSFPLAPLAEQERIATNAMTQLQRIIDARGSIESALRRNAQQEDTILEAAALGGLVEPNGTARSPKDLYREPQQQTIFSEASEAKDDLPNPDFTELLGRALPPGWRWIRVDQAGEVRLGRQRSPEHEYGAHLIPYLRVANVFEDRIDTSDVRVMNFTPEEQKIYHLEPGDILLSEGQSPELVGRPAMYAGEPPSACFQNSLIRFRAAKAVNPRFAILVFRHYLRSGQFTRAARWSTNIAHLGSSRFAAMPFPLPPREEQDLIAKEAYVRLQASKAQRISIESSIHHLQDMHREILRSAVSGTLTSQSPDDEPAETLLARLGPPSEPKARTNGEEKRMSRRAKNRDEPAKSLYETLLTLQGPTPPERLFEASGYNRDSTEDVEAFYVALREELGGRIRQRETKEGLRLEVADEAR